MCDLFKHAHVLTYTWTFGLLVLIMTLLLSMFFSMPYAFTMSVSLLKKSCSLLLVPAMRSISSAKNRQHEMVM